jgi:glyoxylase-like metal-dependent hydrolase (beta-lactamase superfamily II)
VSDRVVRVGDVELMGVSDATVTYPWPLEQLFPGVPEQTWEQQRAEHPEVFADATTWRSDYTSYVLRSGSRTILVEAGMGPAEAPLAAAFGASGELLDRLASVEVAPEDVDIVVLTHLHPDHVGWNVLPDDEGGFRLTFPNARYVVHAADWEAFHRPEVQAHFPFPFVERTISPLQDLGALELVAGDHRLTEDVELLHTPGHTPGHLSVLVSSGPERALLLGDVVMHPVQVAEPRWNAMFEMDPVAARATRERLLSDVEGGRVLVGARHLPEPSLGLVTGTGTERRWQPVAVDMADRPVTPDAPLASRRPGPWSDRRR